MTQADKLKMDEIKEYLTIQCNGSWLDEVTEHKT